MVEFDWVFAGKEGFMFVEELATTENDALFQVNTIKIVIEFLWDFYFWRIFCYVFMPYFCFFVVFWIQSTVTYSNSEIKGFEINEIFGAISLTYSAYIVCMEIKQMVN